MAMEKLILRSVLYGVDKVPDSWFEKIPGGFYKDKGAQNTDMEKGGQGNDTKDGGASDKRRSSTSNARKARTGESHRESDRNRSDDRKRRNRRSRSSYDGGADEADHRDSGDDRRRSTRGKSDRRRRSVDDDRYGYNDGQGSRHRDRDSRMNTRDPRTQYTYDDRERPSTGGSGPPPPNPYSSNRFDPNVDTGGPGRRPRTAATFPLNFDPTSPTGPSPEYSQPGTPVNPTRKAYVPYAHIYGNSSPRRDSFSRPSTSEGSKIPARADSTSPQVAPPPDGYQQNPFAQQAPTAVDAGAGMQYTGQQGFINKPYDPRSSTRRNMGHDGAQDSPRDSPRPSRDGDDNGRFVAEPEDHGTRSSEQANWGDDRGYKSD